MFNFPDTPLEGQTYSPVGGPSWTYANGAWVQTNPGVSITLDGLTDVDASTPANGEVLTFDDGTATWVAAPSTGGGGGVDASSYNTFADAVAATIPVEVLHLRTAGYYEVGDHGGAMYVKVDVEPTLPGKLQSLDGAWWKINDLIVTPQMFGAKMDGVTDDYQAIQDAIDHVATRSTLDPRYPAGPRVMFLHGKYIVNSTIYIRSRVWLHGVSNGNGGALPELRFPADTTGIYIEWTKIAPDNTSGQGSLIENLYLRSSGPGVDPTKHGIEMLYRAHLRYVVVHQFSGNGIHVYGSAPPTNSNLWKLEYVTAVYNGRHGIFVDGPDGNAGLGLLCDANNNGRYGIYDSSFLGNTWIQCHCANNGTTANVDYNAPGGKSSFVSYEGNRYWAATSNETTLVTTVPGTNESIWKFAYFGIGGGSSPWLPDQPVGTYFMGGAYLCDNANARSVFLGCYTEGGQGASYLSAPCLALGGIMETSGYVRGGQIRGSWGDTLTGTSFISTKGSLDVTLGSSYSAATGEYVLQWSDDVYGGGYLKRDGADWVLEPGTMKMTGTSTVEQMGTGAPVTDQIFMPSIGLGVGNNVRRTTTGVTAPTTGARAVGDIAWDVNATIASAGWICVAAGTPGTWKRFAPGVGADEIATDENFTIDGTYGLVTRHTGTLTAARTVVLSLASGVTGTVRTFVRTGGGDFLLSVHGKALKTNQWCQFLKLASSWLLIASGNIQPLEATATVNPASLAPGQRTATATITVTGAALGDNARASFSLSLSPLELVAWVSAADTVSYYFQNPHALLSGSTTYDAPSIGVAAETTTTVSVTGAVMGDVVDGLSLSIDQGGLSMTGYVSAADTVTVIVKNGTAAPIDLGSGTLRAFVRPFTPTDIGSGTLKVRVEK